MSRVPATVRPTNYVAGLGRGAVGFTTRSDIGPAREKVEGVTGERVDFGAAPAGYVAGMGRGMGDTAIAQGETNPDREKAAKEAAALNESHFDTFAGYTSGNGLFETTPYDNDDVEADRIYEAVDERMDSRRKRAREAKLIETMKKFREDRPKISDQFADLKRELKTVRRDEWEGIPDVGDQTLRYKQKKRQERYTPMTDAMLDALRSKHIGSGEAALDAKQQSLGGFDTPMMGGTRTAMGGWRSSVAGIDSVLLSKGGLSTSLGSTTTTGNLAAARGTVLGLKLDKMSDSITGQTVVDPKGYLTDLNAMKVNSASEVGDIKKARLLLKSVTSTNPSHAPGWIAAARVEEIAGKTLAARKMIAVGCDACPDSEDVWLEAARLSGGDAAAKTILAKAVTKIPTSTKLWLEAAQLERGDLGKKKAVLRKALEIIPNSVKLWRTAIELEDVEDARVLLSRAVECVPQSVDMWLALARLETYDNARKVLNQAREAIPTEPAIWLTAAKLEEAHHHGAELVDRIVKKAVASLQYQYQVVIDREAWLKEAEAAEAAAAPLTCAAVVRHTIGIGVDDEDLRKTWLDDAEACVSRGSVQTARAIYAHALTLFPTKKSIWLQACDLEKKHGTPESFAEALENAVAACPTTEVLWLMAAKEKWLLGDVDGARAKLMDAFAANPDSEQVWLAAAKLEWENDETDRAKVILAKARQQAPTPRVWMKSALLERSLGNVQQEMALIDEAIKKFPTFPKFYMMAGQAKERLLQHLEEQQSGVEETKKPGNLQKTTKQLLAAAREVYQRGARRCPNSYAIWILSARLEERYFGPTKARSVLELARLKNPKTPELWLAAIRLERRHNNNDLASNLAAKALQECPDSGLLWADEIATASKPAKKGKSLEAIKRNDNDPHIVLALANFFADDHKKAKARKWFNRAVALDPDLGDAWAFYYAFERDQGDDASVSDVETRCQDADPAHGELWTSVSKDPIHLHTDVLTKLHLAADKVSSGWWTNHVTGKGTSEEDDDFEA